MRKEKTYQITIALFPRTNSTKMPAEEKKKNCTVHICQKKIFVHCKFVRKKYLYSANLLEKKSCKTPCQKRKIAPTTPWKKKNCAKHPLRKK